jgi:hypothetical protein
MIVLVYPFMSLISFFVAVLAAVWAVELYRLLRAGEGGRAWRVLIIATIVFAIQQLYAIGRGLGFIEMSGVAEITQVVFVVLLAYAFYTQRRIFLYPQSHRTERDSYKSSAKRERLDASLWSFAEEEDDLDDEAPLRTLIPRLDP